MTISEPVACSANWLGNRMNRVSCGVRRWLSQQGMTADPSAERSIGEPIALGKRLIASPERTPASSTLSTTRGAPDRSGMAAARMELIKASLPPIAAVPSLQ